jgi:hypothetical protein
MYLNNNFNFLLEHFNRKTNFEDKFNLWLSNKKEFNSAMLIIPRELNERFKLLSKPFDTYCKQNFIDYNFIVDQILQMSLPYSEGKADRGGSHDYNEGSREPTLYDNSMHFIKQERIPQEHKPLQTNEKSSFFNHSHNQNNDNTYNSFQQRQFFERESEGKRDIQHNPKVSDFNTLVQSQNLLSNLNNVHNLNNQQSMNFMGLGRLDSFNFFRDGSNTWDRNENLFLSRGPSQIFPPNEDDDKNFLGKSLQMRNVSVTSLIK